MDHPDKVMSTEYDMCYVQEATELRVQDWEALCTRLRNGRISFQQLLADTNPSSETHWLKQRCNTGATRLLESRHADNPTLIDDQGNRTERGEAYLGTLDRLTGVRRLRLRDGLWVSAEGIVYEDFDPAIHVVDPFPIPTEWRRWWSVDFGTSNPCVIQCWAEDHDGRLYLYRELYMSGDTIDHHVQTMLSVVAPDGIWTEPKPSYVICDHDLAERMILERELGIGSVAANKKVTAGLQAVASRLRPDLTGKPRLALLRGATLRRDPRLVEAGKPASTAEELTGYVWKDNGRDEPVKKNDHGCDALRYLVADRDLNTRPNVGFW
jgi:phage terminase large subunit